MKNNNNKNMISKVNFLQRREGHKVSLWIPHRSNAERWNENRSCYHALRGNICDNVVCRRFTNKITLKIFFTLIVFVVMFTICSNTPSSIQVESAVVVNDIRDATVFTVNEYVSDAYGLELAKKVKSHVWLRAWFKWSEAMDYNARKELILEAHKHGALFGGGVTVSAIYRNENKISEKQFLDLVTYDPERNLYYAFGEKETNYFHGAVENKKYLDFVLSFAYQQIDAGIDNIFMDEVHGAYSVYEGFDDYGIKAFREYLLKKYIEKKGWAYDDKRWTDKFNIPLNNSNICPDGTIKSFNYREYLKHYRVTKSPNSFSNPLGSEWGTSTHLAALEAPQTYSAERNDRVWKYIVDSIKEYAAKKGRKIYITANGNNRYVDFQIDGLWLNWARKDGKMDGSISQIHTFKTTIDFGRMLTDKSIPVVFFHDWGPLGIPWKTLSTQDKINWMRIYGAEIYAAGGFFAFPVSGPTGDSSQNGTLDEIIRQTNFYYKYNGLYKKTEDIKAPDIRVKTSIPNITITTAKQRNPARQIIHLINHNYSDGKILTQQNFTIKLPLKTKPLSIKIVSPDLLEKAAPEYIYENNNLKIIIPFLEIYDVIVIN